MRALLIQAHREGLLWNKLLLTHLFQNRHHLPLLAALHSQSQDSICLDNIVRHPQDLSEGIFFKGGVRETAGVTGKPSLYFAFACSVTKATPLTRICARLISLKGIFWLAIVESTVRGNEQGPRHRGIQCHYKLLRRGTNDHFGAPLSALVPSEFQFYSSASSLGMLSEGTCD